TNDLAACAMSVTRRARISRFALISPLDSAPPPSILSRVGYEQIAGRERIAEGTVELVGGSRGFAVQWLSVIADEFVILGGVDELQGRIGQIGVAEPATPGHASAELGAAQVLPGDHEGGQRGQPQAQCPAPGGRGASIGVRPGFAAAASQGAKDFPGT